jgi:hypothetical protein
MPAAGAVSAPSPPSGANLSSDARWRPTLEQVRAIEKQIKSSARLDPDDQKAVAAKLIAQHGGKLWEGIAPTPTTVGNSDIIRTSPAPAMDQTQVTWAGAL